MEICSSCGARVAFKTASCRVCGEQLETTEAPDHQRKWVIITAQLECRSCGHDLPLNYLDCDGAVRCGKCGIDQKFPVEKWREILSFAAGTADLTTERTSASTGIGDPEVITCPGQPVCSTCHEPLSVTTDDDCRTSCSCGTAVYRLPEEAEDLPVLAVIADEHRTDKQIVKTTLGDADVVAVSCPQCGSNLTGAVEGSFVTCNYCEAVARVPAQVMRQLNVEAETTRPWALLFEGTTARVEPTPRVEGAPAPRPEAGTPKIALILIPAILLIAGLSAWLMLSSDPGRPTKPEKQVVEKPKPKKKKPRPKPERILSKKDAKKFLLAEIQKCMEQQKVHKLYVRIGQGYSAPSGPYAPLVIVRDDATVNYEDIEQVSKTDLGKCMQKAADAIWTSAPRGAYMMLSLTNKKAPDPLAGKSRSLQRKEAQRILKKLEPALKKCGSLRDEELPDQKVHALLTFRGVYGKVTQMTLNRPRIADRHAFSQCLAKIYKEKVQVTPFRKLTVKYLHRWKL